MGNKRGKFYHIEKIIRLYAYPENYSIVWRDCKFCNARIDTCIGIDLYETFTERISKDIIIFQKFQKKGGK